MRRAQLLTDESLERDDQRGFVVIWLAIVLVLLLSIAAFAVDLVHAYAEAQKLQNAVDAAALAGATQIPADLNGDLARKRVEQILKDNDFDKNADPNVQVVLNDIDPNNPNQMNVQVKYRFPTFFGRIMGFSTLTVARTAYGQYDAKIAMGSPANNLGDVPYEQSGTDSSCADLNPGWTSGATCAKLAGNAKQNLFLQIQGRDTRKSAGGAYSAEYCQPGSTDGCDGSPGAGGTSKEYDAGGQYYMVHNDSPGQPLVIAVYDAGFVHVGGDAGSFCNGRPAKNQPPNNIEGTPLESRGQIGNADPARYYMGSPYCAGDTAQLGRTCTSGDGAPCAQNLNTMFDVLAADDSPSDPTDNPVLSGGECGVNGAPWNVPGEFVQSPDLDPANAPWTPQNILKDATVSDGAGGTQTLKTVQFFQHWRVLCTLSPTDSTNEDYIVRVRAPNGQGSNNFSILALHSTSFPPTGALNVFTKQRLPLFAAMPGGGTGRFYVARIQPAARGRQLDIDLFDLGDSPGASNTGTIQIAMENAHIQGSTNFTDCSFTKPPGSGTGSEPIGGNWDAQAPWGGPSDLTDSDPLCSIRYDRTQWNGQWVTLHVNIPGNGSGTGYQCRTGITATPEDCWIKMNITPDSGLMSDATTWNAKLSGAPVRLVK